MENTAGKAELPPAGKRRRRGGRAALRGIKRSFTQVGDSAAVFASAPWTVIEDFRLPRLGRRIDAVVLLPRAIVACTVRAGRRHTARDRAAAEDAALDLHDFHAASRAHPVVPLLVTRDATQHTAARPLMLPGVTPIVEASEATLDATLTEVAASAPLCPALDPLAWQVAAYRPLPSLIEAARMLYLRHDVADIASAHADAQNLRATREAITAAIRAAAVRRQPTIVFITGIPGAGKTLCGLDTAFSGQAAFLTGNPTLVHVLREALARDAAVSVRAGRQRMEAVIQRLPAFRDYYALTGIPPERVVVIDEAQRCWSAAHAALKTAARTVPLADSEPGILLDIMARRQDGPVVVCLVGNGQEIHDGEGGLAEWGRAVLSRPAWQAFAAPCALTNPNPRERLPALPLLQTDPALHLGVPVRSLRSAVAPAWVDAVLAGDTARARSLSAKGVPFSVTRDLGVMRARLRHACRGTRRAGLLCSSGAKRLQAEGLGATLPHDDPAAVARWFLDYFPDVRASDALEVAATEFFAQGLELDAAGLCWDGDLVRDDHGWHTRAFRGTSWTRPLGAEKLQNKLNAYRVLLTRARYETVIWVPRGDAADPTRDPARLDAVARYLVEAGAHPVGGMA